MTVRPFFNGAPGAIRTPGPQIRSLMLYPAELQAQTFIKLYYGVKSNGLQLLTIRR